MTKTCKCCNQENTPETLENLRAWPGTMMVIGECCGLLQDGSKCSSTIAFVLEPIQVND